MDFRIIFQLKEKRFWWMDVIFYFAMSLLLAAVFSYIVFLLKNNMQRIEIEQKTAALKTIGTQQQKEYEQTVISYQKKIRDFTDIFENHKFASHVFSFMQSQTMPNIWFGRFELDKKNNKVQLLGEADNMDDFSRQVANFEKNEYVKSVGALNSTLGKEARVQFNINLILDSKLFSYAPDISDTNNLIPVEGAVTSSSENIFQTPGQETKKMITVFDLLLSPEVIGSIDQNNRAIKLDIPYGTDTTNLTPLIIVSSGATVSPASYVAQDFTGQVVYRVTAKDGSAQDYTVAVNVLPQAEQPGKKFGFGAGTIFIILGLVTAVFLAGLAVFFAFKKRLRKNENEN